MLAEFLNRLSSWAVMRIGLSVVESCESPRKKISLKLCFLGRRKYATFSRCSQLNWFDVANILCPTFFSLGQAFWSHNKEKTACNYTDYNIGKQNDNEDDSER